MLVGFALRIAFDGSSNLYSNIAIAIIVVGVSAFILSRYFERKNKV